MKRDYFFDHPTPSPTPTLHQRYDVQLMPVSAPLLQKLSFRAALKNTSAATLNAGKIQKEFLFNDAMMRANLFWKVNAVI
jgi:hypothetical protein